MVTAQHGLAAEQTENNRQHGHGFRDGALLWEYNKYTPQLWTSSDAPPPVNMYNFP